MIDKEEYRRKLQEQLDEWKAEAARLKVRAAGARAEAQIELKERVHELEHRIREAGDRLSALAEASEEAWDTARKGVESSWRTLKASLAAATATFKEHGKEKRDAT